MDEYYIWTSLVPRLVHPAKLTLVRALIEAGGPRSVEDLISLSELEGDPNDIHRHAAEMAEAGALEVNSDGIEAGNQNLLYFFPQQQEEKDPGEAGTRR